VEVRRICADFNLPVKPLNIHEWRAVEYRVVSRFTGDERVGLTWMWENRIRVDFDCCDKMFEDWQSVCDTLRAIVPPAESLWLFLEDQLRLKTKFWGYSGDITSIVVLLGELPPDDFYIVSKKLRWVAGQNHHDVLFAYGELAEPLRNLLSPDAKPD
jgi:hypothetical protein